jgi:predicted ATPase
VIKSAAISHYKSINEAYLKFNKINVIVGPNGSGKSNILDAIYFLRDCVVDDIDTAVTKRHGIDSIRQWSRTRPFNVIIELKFDNPSGSGSYKVVISSTKGQYRILEEAGHWIGPDPRRRMSGDVAEAYHSWFRRQEGEEVEFGSGVPDVATGEPVLRVEPDQLFLTAINGRSFGRLLVFRSMVDELASFSKYNIYPNTLRQPQLISRETTLAEDGSNLASVLKTINSNKRYSSSKENIITSLQAMMPSLSDFQIKSAAGFYVPVLRVEESNGDLHDFNLSQISDGTLRTLGLLAAFYQPNAPSKIGVEEPEQMIHPGALSILQEAISSFVEAPRLRDRQVFVTTHSPTFIDQFEPEDLIWARLVGGLTECAHIHKRQLRIIKEQLFTAGELLITEGFFNA